jgi:hypothetical protein
MNNYNMQYKFSFFQEKLYFDIMLKIDNERIEMNEKTNLQSLQQRCPCTWPNDFIEFWMNSLVLMNGT